MSAIYKPAAALIDVSRYDRRPDLFADEIAGLRRLLSPPPGGRPLERLLANVEGCERLTQPVADRLSATSGDESWKWRAMHALLRACAVEASAYRGWETVTWRRYLSPVTKRTPAHERPQVASAFRWAAGARQHMLAVAYRLDLLPDPLELPAVRWLGVAEKVFGPHDTRRCISAVETVISSWGYAGSRRRDSAA